MNKEKQFYLSCLKDGKKRHDHIYSQMKTRFDISATVIRDILLQEGYIREAGFITRKDGKRMVFYELTGKEFTSKPAKKMIDENFWEDGSPKSRGNAFDWRNFSRGIYTQSELAAVESGRRWGINTASKQILPRWSI